MFKLFTGPNSTPTLPKPRAYVSTDIYSTCLELPLHNWIKISVTKDLKWLIKAGDAPIETLIEAWQMIVDEYQSMVKDEDTDYTFQLKKEIFCLDKDIISINSIINQLSHKKNDELIALLRNEYGFKFRYDDLEKDLNSTITQTKGMSIRLKLKEKEYQGIIAKQQGAGHSATEFDYIQELSVLGNFDGLHIKPKETTVAEYVAVLVRFKSHCKAVEEINRKNGG